MINKIKKISNKIGIDGAVAFTVLTRLIQAGGGIVSIIFIAKFLSEKEQGYYYTFASIVAIQVFFEMGLTAIITQYTAHEVAHIEDILADGNDEETYYRSRVASLLQFCVKWFGVLSLFLLVVLLIAGFVFFTVYSPSVNVNWQLPWVILCISTALNLFIDPILAFFDGLGHVKDMAKVRLLQKSANIILLIILLVCNCKLYSIAIASVVSICINYGQILFTPRLKVLKTVWRLKGKDIINYYQEIFPYQWKIALSWISGFFIFQLFNPVLFATEGPVVAGQMGMTLQAFNGITALSMGWITTKVPTFAQYIAKKDYSSLDSLFATVLKNVMIVNIFLTCFFVAAINVLRYQHIAFANRFLSNYPLMVMAAAVILNQLVFSMATYLRSHKKEPMLVQSITFGILTALSTFILGNMFGVRGLTTGYSVLTVFSVFWTYQIFNKSKALWHANGN